MGFLQVTKNPIGIPPKKVIMESRAWKIILSQSQSAKNHFPPQKDLIPTKMDYKKEILGKK